MAERPTASWRRGMVEEAAQLAAGTLDPDCSCMAELFPDGLLVATDEVLDAFEGELSGLSEAGDEDVFAVVERVVLALNAVDEAHDGAAFETVGLTARHGLGRYQLTDQWRKW
ncbi:hypothetical protein [Streptomyces nigra]|uniref:hypothetical protein n=1 Tax=Streptomyces nigra TaxID=1827580 RepID=UPI0034276679